MSFYDKLCDSFMKYHNIVLLEIYPGEYMTVDNSLCRDVSQ